MALLLVLCVCVSAWIVLVLKCGIPGGGGGTSAVCGVLYCAVWLFCGCICVC